MSKPSLSEQIAEINMEFEECKWQPALHAKLWYIDFDIVRKGMDKILGLVEAREQKMQELADLIKNRPFFDERTRLGQSVLTKWAKELSKKIVELTDSDALRIKETEQREK
jgi:hypothetical protein